MSETNHPPLPIPVHDPVKLRRLAIIADACLALDDLRELGLLKGGVTVNRTRSALIIAYARERNVTWTEQERNEAAIKLNCSPALLRAQELS